MAEIGIPRGFDPGRAAATYGAAAGAMPSPLQVTQPYQAIATAGANIASEAQKFALAAQADQDLEDKIAAAGVAGDVNAELERARNSIREDMLIKGDDEKDHKASDYVDPSKPWEKGTYGGHALKQFGDTLITERLAKLPKKQQLLARGLIQEDIARNVSDLETKLVDDRLVRRAVDAVDNIRKQTDPDKRRAETKAYYEAGVFDQKTRDALDAETAQASLHNVVAGFTAKEQTGKDWQQTRAAIENDPHALPEDKAKALGEIDTFFFNRDKRWTALHWEQFQAGTQYLSELYADGALTQTHVQQALDNHLIDPKDATAWTNMLISRNREGATIVNDPATLRSLYTKVDTLSRGTGDQTSLISYQKSALDDVLSAVQGGLMDPKTAPTIMQAIYDAPDQRFKTEDYKDAMRHLTRIITGTEADSIDQLIAKITVGDADMARLNAAQSELKTAMKAEGADPVAWAREHVLEYASISQSKTLTVAVIPNGASYTLGGVSKPVYPNGDAEPPDVVLYQGALHELYSRKGITSRQLLDALEAAKSWRLKYDAGLRDDKPKGEVAPTSQPAKNP